MSIAGEFSNGIKEIINQLGGSFTIEDHAGATRTVQGVITSIGRDDAALVNALGIEARVFWTERMLPPPVKFDVVRGANNVDYTIHTVHDVMVDDTIVAHKAYISA